MSISNRHYQNHYFYESNNQNQIENTPVNYKKIDMYDKSEPTKKKISLNKNVRKNMNSCKNKEPVNKNSNKIIYIDISQNNVNVIPRNTRNMIISYYNNNTINERYDKNPKLRQFFNFKSNINDTSLKRNITFTNKTNIGGKNKINNDTENNYNLNNSHHINLNKDISQVNNNNKPAKVLSKKKEYVQKEKTLNESKLNLDKIRYSIGIKFILNLLLNKIRNYWYLFKNSLFKRGFLQNKELEKKLKQMEEENKKLKLNNKTYIELINKNKKLVFENKEYQKKIMDINEKLKKLEKVENKTYNLIINNKLLLDNFKNLKLIKVNTTAKNNFALDFKKIFSIVYLRYLLLKIIVNKKNILNIYFNKLKNIIKSLKLIEEKENLILRRNKILKDLVDRKIMERRNKFHKYFKEFYNEVLEKKNEEIENNQQVIIISKKAKNLRKFFIKKKNKQRTEILRKYFNKFRGIEDENNIGDEDKKEDDI